jgi:5-methylcytosine-specific restriction enzyme B
MSKEEVYSQITSFNKKIIEEKETKSKKFYYVQDDVAIDKANFFNHLINNGNEGFTTSFNKIIDLCYGSGNLTSHIIFDCNLEYEKVTLNDKDIENRNNDLVLGNKTDFDFLDENSFNEKYNLIIFNPQIGGSESGSVSFESIEPIIYDGSLEEYLDEQGIEQGEYKITYSTDKKKYLIHSDTKSKADMTAELKNIKIFNYNDVFFQSKEYLEVGIETNIVKFRKTLGKISFEDTVIIFFGEEKHFKSLFADYICVRRYLDTQPKQLFIICKSEESKICFENLESEFIEVDCESKYSSGNENFSFDELLEKLNNTNVYEGITGIFNTGKRVTFSSSPLDETGKINNWMDFAYLNILFKGVPGTGKSYAVNNIIENFLNLNLNHDNVLRINIHSASSNSDLMQGIGISSNNSGNIVYNEKQGLILDIIKRATFKPNQPFVLVLEEIQENSLNELIGDLIYLIEDEKRSKLTADDNEYNSYEELVNKLVNNNEVEYYVKIPFLVSDKTEYRKMILPKNLFIFCTSNYRDDKKVIEDNLLRRFEVIEIYPKNEVSNVYVKIFFETLNNSIKEELKDEVHPDRFMIGHAIFKNVTNEKDFFRVLLKVVTEFKDIREIEFDTFKNIIKKVTLPKKNDGTTDINDLNLSDGYFGLIKQLQEKIAYEFLTENERITSTNE